MLFLIFFQLKVEDLQTNAVMLSNMTLTPLTFKMVTKQPFTLVELDPSSNAAGLTRSHTTDMHTLKPRHNLIVSAALFSAIFSFGWINHSVLGGVFFVVFHSILHKL